jgi:hypothetical protein
LPTRRIFDLIVVTGLSLHLAYGLPRMWARKEVAKQQSGLKKLAGAAVLHATS